MLLFAFHTSVCRYPSLRVAYIDEVEETSKDKYKKTVEKVYYSALVKAAEPTKSIDSSGPVQTLDQVQVLRALLIVDWINQETRNDLLNCLFVWIGYYLQIIYRIKLPGPAILGEGKPENQNHAIIFTRGEGLQTIDMNQVY